MFSITVTLFHTWLYNVHKAKLFNIRLKYNLSLAFLLAHSNENDIIR